MPSERLPRRFRDTRKLIFMATCLFACFSPAREQITVYRNGNELLARSGFSEEKDIILHIVRVANERAYLVPRGTDILAYKAGQYNILEYKGGELMHNGSDDFAACTGIAGYGNLGGNHGSSFGRELSIPGHGMTGRDIGAKLTDETGAAYYVMRIINKDSILIHPDGGGTPGFPKFKGHTNEKLFRDGKELKYQKSAMMQMLPAVRVNEISFLVNGREPLPDKTPVKCDFLDHIVDVDAVMPDAVVELVKANPGKDPDMVAKGLPALFNARTVFSYQPRGACVLYQKYKITHDFGKLESLGTCMCWSGSIAEKKNTEFYIPKLKPLKIKAYDKKSPDLDCDFSAIYKMPGVMDVSHSILKTDCPDPEDPSDRFIRLAGDAKREIGVAVGYSLIEGSTARANKAADRPMVYFLYKTRKIYPYCFAINNPKKGDEKYSVIYRQYFNPQIEPDATVFYYHKEGKSDVVYLDFHKDLKNKTIRLPGHFTGRAITVIEQTPSLTLHTAGAVPAEGIELSVKDNYGYLVLKLDERE